MPTTVWLVAPFALCDARRRQSKNAARHFRLVDPPEIQWNQVIDELRELRYILYSPEVSIKDLKE